MNKAPDTAMAPRELELVKKIAERYGITVEEAQTQLAKSGLARRVRRRTGRGPARVYGLKK